MNLKLAHESLTVILIGTPATAAGAPVIFEWCERIFDYVKTYETAYGLRLVNLKNIHGYFSADKSQFISPSIISVYRFNLDLTHNVKIFSYVLLKLFREHKKREIINNTG